MTRPRHHDKLFTIAPHAPFLKTLVDRICDGTLLNDWDIRGPFGLSDVTIILPTRRARLALADAFATKLGGAALLPDIRTFGGAPEEEEPFLPPYDAAPIPPSVSPLKQKLILAQLIEAWTRARNQSTPELQPGAGEILSLAQSLADLIDDCHVEQIDPKSLRTITPENLAANWQTNLEFLDIALDVWPNVLAERAEIDAAAARNLKLQRQTDALSTIFEDRPVIAAGSTGSIPATANLLQAVTRLERGALVLPGLDTSLSAESFATLTNPENDPHGHPQYGLAQLVDRLGTTPDNVIELAPESSADRTSIIRQALALADETAKWAETRPKYEGNLQEAFAAVSAAVARNDEEQARAIAVAAREALANQTSVGIISPDRNLARRIAAELQRFEIEVDDSAGTPLFQSSVGRLARQVLAVAAKNFAPVDIMALLRNRRASIGLKRADLTNIADLLDVALLRGPRPAPGVQGLVARLDANLADQIDHPALRLSPSQGAQIRDLIEALQAALTPLVACLENTSFSVSEFVTALGAALANIVKQPDNQTREPWPEYRQLDEWISAVQSETGNGPRLTGFGIEASLEALMGGLAVRSPRAAREDIAIWGQLEARLQNPDLLILAGLNEGTWPEATDPGPWLNRAMRLSAGLEPPERRQGQAAHDFEMAMGNAEVLITRADRQGTSPATPSRLLQRLDAYLGPDVSRTMQARGQKWVQAARDLDFVATPQPAARPAPKPPISKRPKSLSITEIETLIRSPYDLYAKYVLGLRRLDGVGEDPDASARGTLIHAIFGNFVEAGHDPEAANAVETLYNIAETVFTALEATPERRTIWLERFKPAADAFIDFERARAGRTKTRHAELYGKWAFPIDGATFTLRGRADRIDEMLDGSAEIFDFKTGSVPSPGEMKLLNAPQLPLEAAMVREEAFEALGARPTSVLAYIKIGAGPTPFELTPFSLADGQDIAAVTDDILRRLYAQISAYLLTPDTAMASRIFPNPKQRYRGDYDHLARTGEWTLIDGEDEAL